jgi:hypothetical protein
MRVDGLCAAVRVDVRCVAIVFANVFANVLLMRVDGICAAVRVNVEQKL